MLQKHWDQAYLSKSDSELGWYESNPTTTLELLQRHVSLQQKTILLTGAGTTTLVEPLLDLGNNLILNDLSCEALNKLQSRLPITAAVEYCCGDLGDSQFNLPSCEVWIDRAVLHFLLDETAIANYFAKLRRSLKSGGYALFAEFAHGGAPKCNGLAVKHYNVADLQRCLGDEFTVLEEFDYTFINPSGNERPYLYALFKRK